MTKEHPAHKIVFLARCLALIMIVYLLGLVIFRKEIEAVLPAGLRLILAVVVWLTACIGLGLKISRRGRGESWSILYLCLVGSTGEVVRTMGVPLDATVSLADPWGNPLGLLTILLFLVALFLDIMGWIFSRGKPKEMALPE